MSVVRCRILYTTDFSKFTPVIVTNCSQSYALYSAKTLHFDSAPIQQDITWPQIDQTKQYRHREIHTKTNEAIICGNRVHKSINESGYIFHLVHQICIDINTASLMLAKTFILYSQR